MITPTAVSPGRFFEGNYRWVVCALLFFATTVNYIDRQILSLLKPILDEQLHWTNEEFGIVNSAFQGAYGIGLLFFGWFIDRFGTKIGYAVSIAAWSVAAIGHAFVSSVGGFIGARIALGLGEGGNFPSAIKAVALWFPKKERAFATSIFNSGTNVGAIIAPAIVPWIAFTWGWQAAFVAAGIAGFLWLLLWIPFYEIPEKIKHLKEEELVHIRSDADETPAGEKASWGSLLRYRQTWAFLVAKGLTDPIWWFFLIWLPDFFKQTRGLDIKKSWIHLVTIYTIVTVLSIAGGWVTGYLTKRGWTVTRARKSGMFLFALLVTPDLCRDDGRRLDCCVAHRACRRCAPGVVGKPLYHSFRHVPEARCSFRHRYRWHGRSPGRDDVSCIDRKTPRCVQGIGRCHCRLCDPLLHLCMCICCDVCHPSFARSTFRNV